MKYTLGSSKGGQLEANPDNRYLHPCQYHSDWTIFHCMTEVSLTGVRKPELTMSQARRDPDQSLSTVSPGSLIHSAAVREKRHKASPKTKLLESDVIS